MLMRAESIFCIHAFVSEKEEAGAAFNSLSGVLETKQTGKKWWDAYTRNGHFSPDTYCSVGGSCSTAGERMHCYRQMMGSIPTQ